MRWIAIAVVLGSVSIWPRIAWTLANPASQFCIKSGGKSEIRTGPMGSTAYAGFRTDVSSTSGAITAK